MSCERLEDLLVCQPMFFTNGVRSRLNWPTAFSSDAFDEPLPRETDFHPLVMRGSGAGDELRNGGMAREATTAFVATRFRSSTKLPACAST